MNCSFLLILALMLEALAVESKHEKYNDDFDEPRQTREFRSARVQQLWDKAMRTGLPEVTMTDLYGDLKHHDHRMMDLKLQRAHGDDDDGTLQAELQEDFYDIMFRYGLAGNRRNDMHDSRSRKDKDRLFDDPKLEFLWEQAVSRQRFSPEELDKLHLEFKRHQEKQLQLSYLVDDLHRHHQASENSVEQRPGDDARAREEHVRDLHEELRESYERLHRLSQKNWAEDSVPFAESRVLELWDMMRKGNFSDSEQESFKEELRHLEKRLEKHRHYREQLRNSAEKLDFQGGREKASPERLNLHQSLQEKVSYLADKVQKTFTSLRNRLKSGKIKHGEL